MYAESEETLWNAKLPKHLEQEILQCLGQATGGELALEEIVSAYPDHAREIRAWARNAAQFEEVGEFLGPPLKELEKSASDMAIPSQIDNYRVIEKISSGGFGIVYLVQDNDTGNRLALKVLRETDSQTVASARREVALMKGLDHPSIVDIYSVGETPSGRLYYVMDFAGGQVLDSFFGDDFVGIEGFLFALLQIIDALTYIHEKGVVHRDVKPENIVVDTSYTGPRAHLVDFGIASLGADGSPLGGLRMRKEGNLFEQTVVTSMGRVVGTPAFMSPEQLLHPTAVDGRSDFYSLGVTIYLMLTGRFPIEPREILRALRSGPDLAYETIVGAKIAPPTASLKVEKRSSIWEGDQVRVPWRFAMELTHSQRRRVDDVVLRCLEKEPGQRYADGLEFSEELSWAFGIDSSSFQAMMSNRWWGRLKGLFPRARERQRRIARRYSRNQRAKIWFATNRLAESVGTREFKFGTGEDDALTFGSSIVGIPRWRAIGRIAPRIWDRLRGPSQYRVIANETLSESAFSEGISKVADDLGVLIFVHGYNTSFDEAIIRAVQLQTDLKLSGRVICFSWPSRGSIFGYGADAAMAEASERHLMSLLRLVASLSSNAFVHVMAHSMGNRALLRAVSRLSESGDLFKLRQVVLAAPDVGQSLFEELAPVYVERSDRSTIYASKSDRALMGSRFLYARGRAGYIPPVTIVDGIDTVDASRIGFRLWGLNHSNFGDTREILSDIMMLIRQNLSPHLRIGLERQIDTETGREYWVCIR